MQQRLQEQTSLVGFVFSLITVRNMCLCGLVVTAQLNIHRSCDTISDVGIVENLWKILFISCKINSSEEEALFSATSNKLGQCVSMCVSAHEHISGAAGPNCTKFVVQIPCDRGSVLLWWRCDTLCTSGLWMTARLLLVGKCHVTHCISVVCQ